MSKKLSHKLSDSHQQFAIWDGRFQPFHVGHLNFARKILEVTGLPLVIMIIQSSEAKLAGDYSKEVNRHHKLSRNPLTLWERRCIVKMALEEAGISDQVDVVGIPRPDLYWEIAKLFYPPKRFMCLSGKDDYERNKEIFWAALGEETRVIPYDPEYGISASEVKAAIKDDKDWEHFLPASCHEYFNAIEGPRRFKEADL